MAVILFDLMTIRIHDAPANLLRLLTEAGYIHDVALTKRVANWVLFIKKVQKKARISMTGPSTLTVFDPPLSGSRIIISF